VIWLVSTLIFVVGEIPHYAVFQFASLGIPENVFIEEYLPSFRHTTYVSLRNSCNGKLSLNLPFVKANMKNVRIHDRLGTLHQIFSSLDEKAKIGQAGIFSFSPFFAKTRFNLDYVISSRISASLTKIFEDSPFLPLITSLPEQNSPTSTTTSSADNDIIELLSFLKLLESINSITFSYDGKTAITHPMTLEIQELEFHTSDRDVQLPSEEIKALPAKVHSGDDLQLLEMRKLGFDEDFVESFSSEEDASVEVTAGSSENLDIKRSNLQNLLKTLKEKASMLSSRIEQNNSDVTTPSPEELNDFLKRSMQVGLPQKLDSTITGYRNPSCLRFVYSSDVNHFITFGEIRNRQTICLEPKPVKRKTACKPIINSNKNIFYPSSSALNIASQAKLNFDFHQLSLLLQNGVVDEKLSGPFFNQISSPQTTLKVLCIALSI
jgi:hypothetical protein